MNIDDTKAKNALRIEFLKELPEQLVKEKIFSYKDDLTVEDDGKIVFSRRISFEN